MRLRLLVLCLILFTIVIVAVRRSTDPGSAAEPEPGENTHSLVQLEATQPDHHEPASTEGESRAKRTFLIRGSASIYVSNRERAAVAAGTLQFTLEDPVGNLRVCSVPVRDSIWHAELKDGEVFLADAIDVAGRIGRPLLRNPIVDFSAEIRLVFVWEDGVVLTVLDELSRDPLNDVAFFAEPIPGANFSYPDVDSANSMGPSPVHLERERYSSTRWVGARGYAWTAVHLEPVNNHRTVLLSRGADLDILLESVEPTNGAWIELVEAEGERKSLWLVTVAGNETEWRLRGLPRSRYVVRAGRNSTPTASARRAPDVEVDGTRGGLSVARLRLDGAEAACGRLAVEVLLPAGLSGSTEVSLVVREPRSDGRFDGASPPGAEHSASIAIRGADRTRWMHVFECVRPGSVQVEVSPFGHTELAEVRAGEETRLLIDLSRPFVVDVSVRDAQTHNPLPGALVLCRSMDSSSPGAWTQPLRSKAGRFHFETTATRVEINASLTGRTTAARIVNLGTEPTDIQLELKRVKPVCAAVQLREGEEPVAVSSRIWTRLKGQRLDGEGELSSFELMLTSAPVERQERVDRTCSAVLATFSFAGRYRIELDGVPGFQHCEAECEITESTGAVTLQLRRKER